MANDPRSPFPDHADLVLCLRALEAGTWDYDLDADALTCDDRWYGLLKLTPGSVRCIGDFRPMIHPDDVEIATRTDPQAISDMIAFDRRYHVDFRVIRTDGVIRQWRSVACLIIDEQSGHRRAVGCVTDITDAGLLIADRHMGDAREPDRPEPGKATLGEPLSEKELECLRWVSVGKTAWETAIIMDRSRRTIEFHLLNAMRKLGASNKVHVAVIAVRQGLI